jgi:hypothetical protein
MNLAIRSCAGISLAIVAAALGAQEIKPGLWEVSMTMQMAGMALPGVTVKHCLTAKDIAAGKQYNMSDKDSTCNISNLKTSGGSYSFDMACTSPQGKMTGSAKGTTTTTSYATEMKMRMTPDEGMGEMTQSLKGRLLGDCK